jgi:hydrogenase expression/formation protein HypC
MCLAVPVLVVGLHGEDSADVEVGGITSRVCIALIEGVAPGDYLIVHAGFAITRLDEAEAQKSLALFAEISAHLRGVHALHSRIS